MDVNVQAMQLDVLLSANERPSLMLAFDQYSRLIIDSELLYDAPNSIILEDSIKKIMKRGGADNVTS
jgi:hypothetical protein